MIIYNFFHNYASIISRDIVKKKREEQIKMVWRVMPVHKKLQTRMEQMRKFRHQHEQLRTVILRVLRPGPVSLNGQEDKIDDAPNMSAVEVIIIIGCLS